MILTSEINANIIQIEGTEVNFMCTVNSNPAPQTSLWLSDENGLESKASSEQFVRTKATFTITLNRNHNGKEFFCKAENHDLQYTMHSNKIGYSIICKFSFLLNMISDN